MYLAALRTAGAAKRTTSLTFSRNYVTETFGVGESTRKSGLRNLSELLVLDAHLQVADDDGDSLRRRRRRTIYDLLGPYTAPAPAPAPAPGEADDDDDDEPARFYSPSQPSRESTSAAPAPEIPF